MAPRVTRSNIATGSTLGAGASNAGSGESAPAGPSHRGNASNAGSGRSAQAGSSRQSNAPGTQEVAETVRGGTGTGSSTHAEVNGSDDLDDDDYVDAGSDAEEVSINLDIGSEDEGASRVQTVTSSEGDEESMLQGEDPGVPSGAPAPTIGVPQGVPLQTVGPPTGPQADEVRHAPLPNEDDLSSDSGTGAAANEAKLRSLKRKARRAKVQAEIEKLSAEQARGFAPAEQTATSTAPLDRDRLQLEKARAVRHPEMYSGQSQKHFDKYVRQVESTLNKMPTVYATDFDKCYYACDYLAGTPAADWLAMEKEAKKSSPPVFSYEAYKVMLQEGLIPKKQREGKVLRQLWDLKQLPNQSIGDLLSHMLTLERQLEEDLPDWVGRWVIMMACHNYLEDHLRSTDRLGKTRLELEEALRAAEGVVKPPPGITVKETYRVGPVEQTPAKADDSKTKRKFVQSGRPSSTKRRERPAEASQKGNTNQSGPKAASGGKVDSASITCYKCNKTGHYAQNCKSKGTVAATQPGDPGKDGGQ